MKFGFLTLLIVLLYPALLEAAYVSLDPSDPIELRDKSFVHSGEEISLGPRAFFIDGRLSGEEASRSPYIFRSIEDAVEASQNGDEAEPMTLYIAPYVYWLDDPDDPEVRRGENGSVPFALRIKRDWLRFEGLAKDARNVVVACNRGQTIGAVGNFTMLWIEGDGISCENLTFGNYCNVDLDYPLDPNLNRAKRADAIVQAQLILCRGDKFVAKNTRFISRLNLCPFVGARRILFDGCHFECTDDALTGTGLYLDCTFDFYSSKPFYRTSGTGAVFLNCEIRSRTRGPQYFTKANGQIALVDTQIVSDSASLVQWSDVTLPETKNYQFNVGLNGETYRIGPKDTENTVEMAGKPLLSAYRFEVDGEVHYNVLNLLSGDDGWDPLGQRDFIRDLEAREQINLSGLPVRLELHSSLKQVETGQDDVELLAKAYLHGNYEIEASELKWEILGEGVRYAVLDFYSESRTCRFIPKNESDEVRQVTVKASTESGLEAVCVIDVSPPVLPAPEFSSKPKIVRSDVGRLKLEYELGTNYSDQSRISWYRSKDLLGNDRIQILESRGGEPLVFYGLSGADIGYFIIASIAPKDARSEYGAERTARFETAIATSDIEFEVDTLTTDFANLHVGNQRELRPGFWTFIPVDTLRDGKPLPADYERDAWVYREGEQGHAGQMGLLQTGRSARALYTHLESHCDSMEVELEVSPFKTAGQGFSVAPLFMDILIKFDNRSMSGYALRFQRTTKFADAVDCYFVKYENGVANRISPSVSTSCYKPTCYITLAAGEGRLWARAVSSSNDLEDSRPEVVPSLDLSIEVDDVGHDTGFGIEYHGGSSAMINNVSLAWR
ncbi:hypothetical protein [Pelagicoccus albus]|uniref:Uncharacterized protein n=1 Tax=Pelagicoccus albus TaxID=415222 RepID=A0A7X1B4X5_9BACT|nr:hypothetical protein [Pelagicoccus albus]MBC2605696.1 hypothetical protein [Pelagicoccus albus]